MKRLFRNCSMFLFAIVFILFNTELVNAAKYGFTNITNNNAGDLAIGEAQLFVEVTEFALGQVLFEFSNTGPAASSITDAYFDDGTLLGIA